MQTHGRRALPLLAETGACPGSLTPPRARCARTGMFLVGSAMSDDTNDAGGGGREWLAAGLHGAAPSACSLHDGWDYRSRSRQVCPGYAENTRHKRGGARTITSCPPWASGLLTARGAQALPFTAHTQACRRQLPARAGRWRDAAVALPLPLPAHTRYDATRPVTLSQRRKQRVASSRSLKRSPPCS